MPIEVDELLGTMERVAQYQLDLRRTADPIERRAIRSRLDSAFAELKATIQRFREAALAGDQEALEFMEALGWEYPEE